MAKCPIFHNKGREEIIAAIDECFGDYSFVVFSGHGFLNEGDGKTYICVADGYISEDELDTLLEKQTLILDCCREYDNLSESFESFLGDIVKSEITKAFSTTRRIINARNKFERALNESTNGKFVGYACLVNQTSADNPQSGGLFSTALLYAGIKFGLKDRNKFWLPIRKATRDAIRILSNDPFTEQIATYITVPPDMELTHPFALTNISKIIR